AVRHHGDAFLGHPHRAWGWVESQLRRGFGTGTGDAPAAGAQQGSGVQRFSGVRDDGIGLVFLRPVAGELRLVGGQPRGVSAGVVGTNGLDACIVRQAAAGEVASRVRISRSEYLTRSRVGIFRKGFFYDPSKSNARWRPHDPSATMEASRLLIC